MSDIYILDRVTGRLAVEKVYKGNLVKLLYGDHWISRMARPSLLPLLCKWPFFSASYGALQKQKASAKKIRPFIEMFDIDEEEFLEPVSHYRCFNDFFIRRLKPTARPIASGAKVAVIPADGRYYFYQNIDKVNGFVVKEEKFNLATLLEDEKLAAAYEGGSMVMARLAPPDYHRFHFPCDCLPGKTRFINGCLYSVNPIAIKRDLNIFTKNKRTVCELQTEHFGRILYLEIGATNVGSIQETYTSGVWQSKGAEKGYFEFGGSALILLFEKGTIQFDQDLMEGMRQGIEIRCLMGQSMGIGQF